MVDEMGKLGCSFEVKNLLLIRIKDLAQKYRLK